MKASLQQMIDITNEERQISALDYIDRLSEIKKHLNEISENFRILNTKKDPWIEGGCFTLRVCSELIQRDIDKYSMIKI